MRPKAYVYDTGLLCPAHARQELRARGVPLSEADTDLTAAEFEAAAVHLGVDLDCYDSGEFLIPVYGGELQPGDYCDWDLEPLA